MFRLTYSEAKNLPTYGDRLDYLTLHDNNVDSPRHLSNMFYKSKTWLRVRDEIIARDMGYDLGDPRVKIDGPVLVHHINPLTEDDIVEWNEDKLFNPENLISVSIATHNTIHYGRSSSEEYVERRPGDTKLW